MAENKTEKATRKDREFILEDKQPQGDVDQLVFEGDNSEIEPADQFVNSEKTLPSERASFSNRAGITNHTLAGMPSDVHQALVSASQLFRTEAMTYQEVLAVLGKYAGEEGLSTEVRSHLTKVANELATKAHIDEQSRNLLERHV